MRIHVHARYPDREALALDEARLGNDVYAQCDDTTNGYGPALRCACEALGVQVTVSS